MEALAIPAILGALLCALLFCAVVLYFVVRLVQLDPAQPEAPSLADVATYGVGGVGGPVPPVDDALVDFFASSNVSSSILRVLGERAGTVRFPLLVNQVQGERSRWLQREEVPLSAIRAVLNILQVAGLVRMQGAAFAATESGRELYRRMEDKMLLSSTERSLNHAASEEPDGGAVGAWVDEREVVSSPRGRTCTAAHS